MRLPRQQVDCRIAAKMVTATLRRGGGLGEPTAPYVRCDQRDCQYVDLNLAPCPLHPDMFRDRTDERVGAFLAAQLKTHVCFTCVVGALFIDHAQVRRTAARLTAERIATIGPRRCGLCRRRRVCFTLVEGAGARLRVEKAVVETRGSVPDSMGTRDPHDESALRRRVVALLSGAPDLVYCAPCIAFAGEVALQEVQSVLRDRAVFEHQNGVCGACGREATVSRVVAPGTGYNS